MIIKITSIEDSKLGKFDAKELKGTRIDNGDEWSKAFFANNRKLADELAEFGVGDNCNIKMVQEGKFWNIAGFSECSDAMIEKVKADAGGGYKAGGTNTKAAGNGYKKSSGGSSDKMSKEEWAEKDRITNIRISKAVALKAAIDNTKVNETPAKLMEMADKFLPYLLNVKLTKDKKVEDKGDDKDPLTPPSVD